MRKPTVYIETSVISDLTARPSNNPINAERQRVTKEWWATQSDNFELVSSTVTRREARRGDRDAARQRLQALQGIRTLTPTDEVRSLVNSLLNSGAIPENSEDDASHVALAAVNNVDYLLTWNQKHLVGPTARRHGGASKLLVGERATGAQPFVGRMNYWEVTIMPNELINLDAIPEDEDSLKELWDIKKQMSREYRADPEKFWAELQNDWSPDHTYGTMDRIFKTKEERDVYIESERIPRD